MTDNWHRVVHIPHRGYCILDPETWAEMDEQIQSLVRVLELCDSEEGAQKSLAAYPDDWNDGVTWAGPNGQHCDGEGRQGQIFAGGEWWRFTGESALNPDGVETELYVPADRPVPIIEMPQVRVNALLGNQPECLQPIDLRLIGR